MKVIFVDIIVPAADEQEHDQIIVKLLQRAREANVKFNTAKLQYKVSEVKYMGNIVSESGLKPDGERVRAIIEIPSPQSKDELRRFLGMVNYFFQFIPKQSEITAPLRQLLKKEAAWTWSPEHAQSVERLKGILSSQPVLKFFDPTKPGKLQVDASKSGLGAYILQRITLRSRRNFSQLYLGARDSITMCMAGQLKWTETTNHLFQSQRSHWLNPLQGFSVYFEDSRSMTSALLMCLASTCM